MDTTNCVKKELTRVTKISLPRLPVSNEKYLDSRTMGFNTIKRAFPSTGDLSPGD